MASYHTNEAPYPTTNPAAILADLRTQFPHVGFVADAAAGRWIAVKGRDLVIRAHDPITLAERLRAALGVPWTHTAPTTNPVRRDIGSWLSGPCLDVLPVPDPMPHYRPA
ncbi:hypothetical protein [Thermomonospora amylolytica]|uniref:hypothetical protein n=1 Tax=Thermomonospora amylolytica TaxID=1411117 RepID=UPI0013006E00|nr:hypothetical protein [Thermomonospora amylolytica]